MPTMATTWLAAGAYLGCNRFQLEVGGMATYMSTSAPRRRT